MKKPMNNTSFIVDFEDGDTVLIDNIEEVLNDTYLGSINCITAINKAYSLCCVCDGKGQYNNKICDSCGGTRVSGT
jgi:hypothetical protein